MQNTKNAIQGRRNSSGQENRLDHLESVPFYKFVINSVPVGILTVNSELEITGFNPWAEKITGYTAEEALGRYCGEVLKGGLCKTQCPLKVVLNKQMPLSMLESTIRNKSGELIPIRMNVAGLFDNEGNLIGGVESFHDISKVKALEREKNNLLSMCAHDMKSSLSIIGGFVLRLLRNPQAVDFEKMQSYLNIIKKESEKLENLINDFLDYSRLQSGRLRPNFSITSLDKELLELLDAYKIKAKESGLDLELVNDQEMILIDADASQLRRVFTNLLDNAIKFSKGKGKISVSMHQDEKEVMIKIVDQGIGIERDDLPFIFDAFHKGKSRVNNSGVGLGLAGVKGIVEAHGGNIQVQSVPGKGSTFIVKLPKTQKTEN